MRAFKIYLYKRQIKKRNLFICFLLLRLLEALVLVFFRVFLSCEAARNCRCVINVILYESHCIRVLHVDDFEHHLFEIFFLLREFFFHNFLHFHVLCRLLANIYHFLIFFLFSSFICCSVAALSSWIVSIIRLFAFVKRFRRRWFFWKSHLINDWAWWLMSEIYLLWMIVSDDAPSTIEIFNLFKTTLLFHLLNGSLLSSLSTY